MSINHERIHYLDNLRALAMLLGIVFHAAIAYGPDMVSLWPSSGGETSVVLDVFAWFTHLWRMPLFFLISGYFAMLLLSRRGVSKFLRNRAMRIAVPFIVFMPLVLAGIVVGMGWAMQSVENPGPMLEFIIAMEASGQAEPPPFSTAHLWFLYNLVQFCLVLAVLFKLGLFESRWLDALVRPGVLLVVLPLTLVPALISQPAPHPAPEQLMPQLWSFGFYGVFFLVGAALYGRLERLDVLRPWVAPLLLISAALYAMVYRSYPEISSMMDAMALQNEPRLTTSHLITTALSTTIAVFMTLACLQLGKRFLSGGSRVMRYIADSSYWVYIIHMPLIFVIQYGLMDVQWGVWPEFLFTTLATLVFGLATYALLVRWTPIGTLLNGRRVPLRAQTPGTRWDINAA